MAIRKSPIFPALLASSVSKGKTEANEIRFYWHDTAPRFTGAVEGPIEGHYDAAVVGGGFTGLGAARQLAMAGARVIVLEAEAVGFGASGRNGGHLNNGLAHSYLSAKQELGKERAVALYKAIDASIDTLEAIVAAEGIDCNFRRAGKLKLASKPQHFEGLVKNFEAVHEEVDCDTLLSAVDPQAPRAAKDG